MVIKFEKQQNKWGYLNNPRWLKKLKAVEFCENTSLPMDLSSTHFPCGHWHKREFIPTPIEQVYTISSGLNSGASTGSDTVHKIDKSLTYIDSYGGRGSGVDELRCPSSITVDAVHIWIADYLNNRIMQRLKSDLSYVQHLALSQVIAVHVDDSGFLFACTRIRFYELNKVDLSTSRMLQYPFDDSEGRMFGVVDITTDDVNIYMVDESHCRVLYYDKSTLTYQGDFGTFSRWALSAQGLCYGDGYLYVSDASANMVYKVDPATYDKLATFGHITGGAGDSHVYYPSLLYFYDSRVFVCDSNYRVKVLDSDLNFITHIGESIIWYAKQVAVDANYIYIVDGYENLHRFDTTTYAFVDTTIPGVDVRAVGLAIDANYIYINDSYDERIMKIDINTLAYVDEYDCTGGLIWNTISSETIHFGTVVSGSIADTYVIDSVRYVIAVDGANNLDVEFVVDITPGQALEYLRVRGHFNGTGQSCSIFVYNNNTSVWDLLATMPSRTSDATYTMTISADHLNVSDEVLIRFTSASTNSSHQLRLDRVVVESLNPLLVVFHWPDSLYVDANYIYVTDLSDDAIHRINKSTMAYVDTLTPASTYNAGQVAVVGGSIYVADELDVNHRGRVHEYDLATMALIDGSPDTYGDPNYWLDRLHGITSDDQFIYVTNGMGNAPRYYPHEVKIYDKDSHTFVDSFIIGDFQAGGLTVDGDYLYVPLMDWEVVPIGGYIKKYLKTSPYTEEASYDQNIAASVDIYPVPEAKHYIENEPIVWPL